MCRGWLASLFGMSILWVVMQTAWAAYGLRENNGPVLSPDADYRVQWMPDADFRGLDRTKQPEYVVPGGRKTYVAGETWQQFRPYYLSTPDGQWHLEVLSRGPMPPFALRAVVGVAVGPLALSVLGLVICLSGRAADRTCKDRKPPPDDRLD